MKTAVLYADDLTDELGRTCEFQVQVMLKAGLEFLASHAAYNLKGDTAELNAAMKTARVNAGDTHSISGGQHDIVMTHLQVIRELSYPTWLQQLESARAADEFFEFDGTIDSLPRVAHRT